MAEIHLSEADRAFIERQVKSGRYKDADEVVADGLSRLGSEDELLRQMIAAADAQLERGEFMPLKSADGLADSIIERGMRILGRKS